MKSRYTAGAVAPVTVDWAAIVQAPRDALPPEADPRAAGSARGQAFAFRSLSREQQLRVWLDSLPPALVSAPRIDWGRLPSRIMTCLLYGRRKNDPERAQLALAAGVAVTNGVLATTVYNHVMAMVFLWERLRATYQLERVGDLTYEQWIHFGSQPQLMRRHAGAIGVYAGASTHMREYFQNLPLSAQRDLEEFSFPELPARFTERFVPTVEFRREIQARRKAKTDVLVPLTTTLVALILERRKAAERFIAWFREQVGAAEQGTLRLPAELEYRDHELDVNRDAFSVEDVRWQGRGVRVRCTLWTPREYADRHGKTWATPSASASRAHGFQSADATDLPERHFLEIHSRHSDGPWFLGIVMRGPLRPGGRKSGGALGYHSGMGGPHRTMANWFGLQTELLGRVFEPEALYRGVLYGTALAILALTSEARQGELVQVSADRFEPVRPYIVKDEHGQPIIDPLSGRPRYSVIILQRLLPKGRRHDSERNFYNVSAAVPLLQEISAGLQARHEGKIPVVPPRSSHYKSDDLRPERYLLQWNGLVLDGPTVNKLIRLVVDGVEFRDVHGRPFPVTTHILRHVGATAARHEYGLPLETMAGILGHTLERTGHAPPATSYYTRLPLQDQLVEQQHAIDRMLDKAVVAREGIAPLDAAEEASALALRCDEQAREVLDRWHTYHPVVFGHCGRAGLCIRGTTRVLCLGCPFLNPRPEFKDRVDTYRRAYEDMAGHLEASGNAGEAREHRRLARLCNTLAHEMDLLAQAESLGNTQASPEALNTGDDADGDGRA